MNRHAERRTRRANLEQRFAADGGELNCIANIVCHLDVLLDEEQKAAINWHDHQSVSLAVMRVISEWNKLRDDSLSSAADRSVKPDQAEQGKQQEDGVRDHLTSLLCPSASPPTSSASER